MLEETAKRLPADKVVLDADAKPPVVIPAAIASKLREYQIDGVKFLYKRFKAGTGAILGDDMGMGSE